MPVEKQQTVEYCCPDERYPISRAVHLGRLARFYPGCRQCPHRYDTATLSARQVELLAETQPRGLTRPLFHDEGADGVYLNDLGPEAARHMAAALGVCLGRRYLPLPLGEGRGEEMSPGEGMPPVVAIAGDGRPISGELVAAASEGLRWTGCHVIDIGPATAPCLAFAVDHLRATGGILIGNPGNQPQMVGLKFWAAGPRPLSAGGSLEPLMQIFQTGADRPTRTYGSLRRFQAEIPYLAGLAEYYHALRPLRFVLDSASGPLAGYLEKLVEPVACRIIPSRTARDRLAEQVVADEAHFAACIDGDGETCRLLDERGRPVPAQRVLLLLGRELLANRPQSVVVLEEGTSPAVARKIEAIGGRVIKSNARRSEMAGAMREHGGLLGGGRSGRFWHCLAGPPLPDALTTITLLLVLLSQNDRPLSEVLDRRAPLG